MTVTDCVEAMLIRANLSKRQLAGQLGYSSHGRITTPLSRNDGMGMTVATLIKWAEAMDYQLILQPIDGTEGDDLILDGEIE